MTELAWMARVEAEARRRGIRPDRAPAPDVLAPIELSPQFRPRGDAMARLVAPSITLRPQPSREFPEIARAISAGDEAEANAAGRRRAALVPDVLGLIELPFLDAPFDPKVWREVDDHLGETIAGIGQAAESYAADERERQALTGGGYNPWRVVPNAIGRGAQWVAENPGDAAQAVGDFAFGFVKPFWEYDDKVGEAARLETIDRIDARSRNFGTTPLSVTPSPETTAAYRAAAGDAFWSLFGPLAVADGASLVRSVARPSSAAGVASLDAARAARSIDDELAAINRSLDLELGASAPGQRMEWSANDAAVPGVVAPVDVAEQLRRFSLGAVDAPANDILRGGATIAPSAGNAPGGAPISPIQTRIAGGPVDAFRQRNAAADAAAGTQRMAGQRGFMLGASDHANWEPLLDRDGRPMIDPDTGLPLQIRYGDGGRDLPVITVAGDEDWANAVVGDPIEAANFNNGWRSRLRVENEPPPTNAGRPDGFAANDVRARTRYPVPHGLSATENVSIFRGFLKEKGLEAPAGRLGWDELNDRLVSQLGEERASALLREYSDIKGGSFSLYYPSRGDLDSIVTEPVGNARGGAPFDPVLAGAARPHETAYNTRALSRMIAEAQKIADRNGGVLPVGYADEIAAATGYGVGSVKTMLTFARQGDYGEEIAALANAVGTARRGRGEKGADIVAEGVRRGLPAERVLAQVNAARDAAGQKRSTLGSIQAQMSKVRAREGTLTRVQTARTPEDYAAVRGLRGEGKSAAEIARETGIPLGTVNTMIRAHSSRGMDALLAPITFGAAAGAVGAGLLDEADAQEPDPLAQDGRYRYPPLDAPPTGVRLDTGAEVLGWPAGYDYTDFKPTGVPRSMVRLEDGAEAVRISVEAPDGRQLGVIYGPTGDLVGVVPVNAPTEPVSNPWGRDETAFGRMASGADAFDAANADRITAAPAAPPPAPDDRLVSRVDPAGLALMAAAALGGREIGGRAARAMKRGELGQMLVRTGGATVGGGLAAPLAIESDVLSPIDIMGIGGTLTGAISGAGEGIRGARLQGLADQINAAQGPLARQTAIVNAAGRGEDIRALDAAGAFPIGDRVTFADVEPMLAQFGEQLGDRIGPAPRVTAQTVGQDDVLRTIDLDRLRDPETGLNLPVERGAVLRETFANASLDDKVKLYLAERAHAERAAMAMRPSSERGQMRLADARDRSLGVSEDRVRLAFDADTARISGEERAAARFAEEMAAEIEAEVAARMAAVEGQRRVGQRHIGARAELDVASPYRNQPPFRVLVNPSVDEADAMLAGAFKPSGDYQSGLRVGIDESGNVYVWDLYKGQHADVENALGVNFERTPEQYRGAGVSDRRAIARALEAGVVARRPAPSSASPAPAPTPPPTPAPAAVEEGMIDWAAMTDAEAAGVLGFEPQTVAFLRERGRLPAYAGPAAPAPTAPPDVPSGIALDPALLERLSLEDMIGRNTRLAQAGGVGAARRKPVTDLATPGARIPGGAKGVVELADEVLGRNWRPRPEGGKPPTGKEAWAAIRERAKDPAFKAMLDARYPAIAAMLGAAAMNDDILGPVEVRY